MRAAQPWIAFYFVHERPRLESAEREAFRRELAQRFCLLCELSYALRIWVNSAATNSAVNATTGVRAAVNWFVLVNRDGEFSQRSTFGPDATCINSFVGNLPYPLILGWRVRPSTTSSTRIRFIPPYERYPNEPVS